jgi:hypothetical protein
MFYAGQRILFRWVELSKKGKPRRFSVSTENLNLGKNKEQAADGSMAELCA